METAAERLKSFQVGQLVMFDSPFALDADEKMELLVTHVREDTGVVTFQAYYMGVKLKTLSAKPKEDGGVIWTGL